MAAKVIDGEAILINLSNGTYYSMDLAGGLLWQLIEAQHSVSEMVAAIGAHYDTSREQAETDVRRVLAELLDAGLVVVLDDAVVAPSPPPDPPSPRLAYEPLRLTAYHDMAELLALDPPHPAMSHALSKPLIGN